MPPSLSPADPGRFRPLMRDLFTGLGGPHAPPRRLRLVAAIRLGVIVPGVYLPTMQLYRVGIDRLPGAAHVLRVTFALRG